MARKPISPAKRADRALCPVAVAQALGIKVNVVANAMRAAGATQALTVKQAKAWKSLTQQPPAWMLKLLADATARSAQRAASARSRDVEDEHRAILPEDQVAEKLLVGRTIRGTDSELIASDLALRAMKDLVRADGDVSYLDDLDLAALRWVGVVAGGSVDLVAGPRSPMKVTRIAYSHRLNASKYAAMSEQAKRLGRVRSEVWQRYGSVAGATLTDRQVRDRWLADGTHLQFGVLANAWKETVRDAMADIAANRTAAKVKVRRAVRRHTADPAEQKRLFTLLKTDRWADDRYLARQMRRQWLRGKNRTHNQIVVRADQHNVQADESGRLWLAIPGLQRRRMVRIPLNTTVAPTGTLRLILRNNRVEVHYQIDAATMPTSQRPCGDRTLGVDKGYTEVLTDADGDHHGENLGRLLTTESDRRKAKGRARAKLRSVMNNAARRGDRAKADRIAKNNLGTIKRDRRDAAWKMQVRTETFTAVHAVVDKAARVVAEDLTTTFAGRKPLGKNTNRRLAAWTKGVTAEALANVSERRGSALVHVNAAYTSQACSRCGCLGRRNGDNLHCTCCRVVWQADVNAAINVGARDGDPDIALYTPHRVVKQILLRRADRHRTRLPVPDSSHPPAAESELSELLSNEQ